MAVAIIDLLTSLGKFQIVISTKHSVVASSDDAQGCKVQNELEAHITNADGAAVGNEAVLNGLEDGCTSCSGSIVEDSASRIMKGQDGQVGKVDPSVGVEVVLEVMCVAVHNSTGVLSAGCQRRPDTCQQGDRHH